VLIVGLSTRLELAENVLRYSSLTYTLTVREGIVLQGYTGSRLLLRVT
jgi:hypothetical protein